MHPAVSSLEACPTPARELRRLIAHLRLRAGIRQPLTNIARSIRQQTEAPFFAKRRGRGGIGGRPGRLKTALTDGRADFEFDELNATEVRNATIKLSSSTSGTLIDIFGAQKIPTLTLSITGPLEAPNLNGRLDGERLRLEQCDGQRYPV